jgi:hypothetical protein
MISSLLLAAPLFLSVPSCGTCAIVRAFVTWNRFTGNKKTSKNKFGLYKRLKSLATSNIEAKTADKTTSLQPSVICIAILKELLYHEELEHFGLFGFDGHDHNIVMGFATRIWSWFSPPSSKTGT